MWLATFLALFVAAGSTVAAATPSDSPPIVNVGIVFDGPPPDGNSIVPERLGVLIP